MLGGRKLAEERKRNPEKSNRNRSREINSRKAKKRNVTKNRSKSEFSARREKTNSSKKRVDIHDVSRKKKAVAETGKKIKNPLYNAVFNIIFYGFVLFMVVGSALFAAGGNENNSILGYRIFGVLTDSMVPRNASQKDGFHSGDIIIVKNIVGNAAEVGDIITFRPSIKSKSFLTHRVKQKMDHLGENKGTYYITQGDANLAEDVPVNEKQVVGKKVFSIPKIGAILDFIRKNPEVSIIFLVSVFGFITVFRYYILNK